MFAAPLAFGNYYVGELARIMIYALAALGLMVVTGFTGQVRLGELILQVIDALAKAGPEGDRDVEQAVLAEVRDLCGRFLIYR